MTYEIYLKPQAIKDLEGLSAADRRRVTQKMEGLRNTPWTGVKKLTNYSPEYRLRIGSFRVLFEVEEESVMIYRIVPRKEAYRK
ncbi:MAG: type II toxin-antitoxin system RelE/ParE family toxin [Deltaproteobacteria bacterium]|nr:type II toxin-antitoxin system RelE/ParE family toxin [Deltaproteobacteria bacterium]